MLEIHYNTPLTLPELQKVEALDAAIYGPEIFTNPGYSRGRFARCPDCFSTAWDGDKLAGAWTTYPVKDGIWEIFLNSPHMVDDNALPEWVIPLEKCRVNHIMALDMVIDPLYQGQGVAKRILEGYRRFVLEREAEGYRFDRLFGYVITPSGYYMMMRYGAEVVKEVEEGALITLDIHRFAHEGPIAGELPPLPPTVKPLSAHTKGGTP